MVEEPIYKSDDSQFTQGEINQMIECFKRKMSDGLNGITSDIF